MISFDWTVTIVLVCLFIGLVGMMLSWAYDLRMLDDDQSERKEYQRQIRWHIELMCDPYLAPQFQEDLLWQLHSLLYEYRSGI